eukprot:TRINITY_DN6104_c0_g1_i1.p1 TRINITY_DN6104_c0_g1~~TRINITY_DN6104_c0_g1_i1.p1  ORF type:complete len:268 (+),score=21.83 TRINITY_DN6104_c0_g1_i1:86-889(+)
MLRWVSFYFAVKSLSAARINEESEGNASTPFTSCSSLERRYTSSMQKIDRSVERGSGLVGTSNPFRLMLAARSVKAARKKECAWLAKHAGMLHREDYPHFKKYVLAQIAKRPCHTQIVASLKVHDFKGFVAAYQAEEGSCKYIRADVSKSAYENASILAADSTEVDQELEKLEAQATSADSLIASQDYRHSLIQMLSTHSIAIPRPGLSRVGAASQVATRPIGTKVARVFMGAYFVMFWAVWLFMFFSMVSGGDFGGEFGDDIEVSF